MKRQIHRSLFGVLVLALAVLAVGVQPAAAAQAAPASSGCTVAAAADKSGCFSKHPGVERAPGGPHAALHAE